MTTNDPLIELIDEVQAEADAKKYEDEYKRDPNALTYVEITFNRGTDDEFGLVALKRSWYSAEAWRIEQTEEHIRPFIDEGVAFSVDYSMATLPPED